MTEINKNSVQNRSTENLQLLAAECETVIADSKGGTPQKAGFWKAVESTFIIKRELEKRGASSDGN